MVLDEILACADCRVGELSYEEATVRCSRCGAMFRIVDGIVDFVSDRAATALDVTHYDQVYLVDDDKVALHYCLLGERLGHLLERPYHSAVELGAGTGLLTAGLARHGNIGRLLVTDISTEMLKRCRARLQRSAVAPATKLGFATNDGVQLGVRDGSADLIVAYFAIHHVLETEACLDSLFRALADDGVVVLVEPCFRFHAALHATLTPVVEKMALHPENWEYRDVVATLTAHQEWGATLRFGDDPLFVEHREDKRFFDRRRFTEMARRVGFTQAVALPFGEDNEPLAAVRAYAAQLPLTEVGRELLIQALSAEMPGPFALLDPLDSRASYAFILSKGEADVPGLPHPRTARAVRPTLTPGTEYPLYDIALHLASGEVSATGWVAAMRPVTALRFEGAGRTCRAIVGAARPDVLKLLGRCGIYPRDALLFSGIVRLEAESSGWPPGTDLEIVAELEGAGDLRLTEAPLREGSDGTCSLHVSRLTS